MAIVELVSYLEQEFGIQVLDEEIIPENFETIDRMAAFVQAKHS